MNKRIQHNPDYTRLILLRHAQTDFNASGKIQGNINAHLNKTGIGQAEKLADKLYQFYKIEHIFSSPLERAQDTAAIVARQYDLDYEVDQDLKEIDFGEISNTSYADLEKNAPDFYSQLTLIYNTHPEDRVSKPAFPNGESFSDIEARMKRFTDQLLERFSGKCVAAVSHGAFIKYLSAYYMGIQPYQVILFLVDNTSSTIFDFYHYRPILRTFNDISHLDEPLPYFRPGII